MEFQRVTVVMPDGRRFGPEELATVKTWVADGRVPRDATLLDEASGRSMPAGSLYESSAPSDSAAASHDPMSSVIPYRNGAALLSYYLGLFSILACVPFAGVIGIVMAGVAVTSGVIGLRRAAENPEAKGRVHCWIGLVCGSLCGVAGIIINIASLIGILSAP